MTIGNIERAIHLTLILGFLLVDFFFFHDLLKPGEQTSPVQVLVGLLSLLVFLTSALSIVRPRDRERIV